MPTLYCVSALKEDQTQNLERLQISKLMFFQNRIIDNQLDGLSWNLRYIYIYIYIYGINANTVAHEPVRMVSEQHFYAESQAWKPKSIAVIRTSSLTMICRDTV